MITANDLIALLNLQPHPKEGGYFRETYRDSRRLPADTLPGAPSARNVSTAIYYLLTSSTFSALHRLSNDEIFHFYLGDPVRMLQLIPGETGRTIVLGSDIVHDQHLQVVVPRGVWQGAMLEPGGSFALLGCTVAPGFDYNDYEHGQRVDLTKEFPQFAELIQRLTL